MAKGLLALLGAPDKGDESGGSLGAAKDILAAIKDSDANALNAALKLHYEECKGGDDYEDDDEEG